MYTYSYEMQIRVIHSLVETVYIALTLKYRKYSIFYTHQHCESHLHTHL